MEKDDNNYSVVEVEVADRDRGNVNYQIQANLNFSSPPYVRTDLCHGRPSSCYDDDEATKATAASGMDGRSVGGLMVDYMLNDVPINSTAIIPSYQHQQQQQSQHQSQQDTDSGSGNDMSAIERSLSFADVMRFAELGPKLSLLHHNQQNIVQQQLPLQDHHHQVVCRSDNGDLSGGGGIDPVSLHKFPVLGNQLLMSPGSVHGNTITSSHTATGMRSRTGSEFGYDPSQDQQGAAEYMYAQPIATDGMSNHHYDNPDPVQLEFMGNDSDEQNFIDNLSTDDKTIIEGVRQSGAGKSSSSNKRKRPRTIKSTEEVESQRMTHIAVERNRRKQMNEHLRVLRSLMPSSYVQRGDQASIIGGAIEFVRELEQLLQCLESQKRRRLYGDQQTRVMEDTSTLVQQQPQPTPNFSCPPTLPTNNSSCSPLGSESTHNHHYRDEVQLRQHQLELEPFNNYNCSNSITTTNAVEVEVGGGGLLIQEETAENKSCIADVEVKVLGFDALIKILSRRRSGQLVKAITALEELHFTILHTNITTIEQTVLYSFNVKVGSEARFTAEDIANSVQQIFTFIHANTT